MIAQTKQSRNTISHCHPSRCTCTNRETVPTWHVGYLRLLPDIRRQAQIRFRDADPERRAEAIQEIISDTLVAYVRLAELGKEDLAYATPLVTYAAAKFRAGRRVGNRLNVRDVMSQYCQRRKGVRVERLDHFDHGAGEWQEIVVEDRQSSPAAIAALRIDFRAWLRTLSARNRRIAETLATGESTAGVARMFDLTAGRVSQLRRTLHDSWCVFVNELIPAQT
jgi:hypothetical protein